MTYEEALAARAAVIPQVGDLVKLLNSYYDNPHAKKNLLVSKVNKETVHVLDPETGFRITERFHDIHIIARKNTEEPVVQNEN